MNGMRMHWVSRLAAVGLIVGVSAGFAVTAVAQAVAGQAYGTYVNTPIASSGQTPLAVLPAVSGTDGAEADAEGSALNLASTLSSDFLNSITSGAVGATPTEAGAQSTASAASINILSGLITPDEVGAHLMSSLTGSGAVSNAARPTFQERARAGVHRAPRDAPVA